MVVYGYLISLGYAAVCVAMGSLLYFLGVPRIYTRKAVHILIGAEWFILYRFMGVSVHFLAVALICTLLLLVEYRLKAVPCVSSDGDNAPGTVYYGAAMTILAGVSLFLPDMMLPFGAAVLCTSLGDGAAGVFGQLIKVANPKIYKRKTLYGYLFNFAISYVSVRIFSLLMKAGISAFGCLIIALTSAGVELLSSSGTDNIAVPVSVSLVAFAMINYPDSSGYLLAVSLIPTVIAIISEKKALSRGGIICATLLGLLSAFALGNGGFILLLLYFALAYLTDWIKKYQIKKEKSKRDYENEHHTHSPGGRGASQVVANGLAAAICLALNMIYPSIAFSVGFVVAMAEALSDTAASGIGAAFGKAYDPLRRVRCSDGESGGVSVAGTLAGLLFAFGYSLAAVFILGLKPEYGVLSGLVAFLGMLVDSVLGSIAQAKFRCPNCGKKTERSVCCDSEADLISGFRLISNSAVNLISNSISVALSVVLVFVLS